MSIISEELANYLIRIENGLKKDQIRLDIIDLENKLDNLSFWCLLCKLDNYSKRLEELEIMLDELQ